MKLTGEVKKFVTITPEKVIFKGTVGETISQTIAIVPNTEEPLELLKVLALKGTDFTFSLREFDDFRNKSYSLYVENTRKSEGRYYDKITIITGRSDLPPLTIIVSGDIKKAGSDKKETSVNPTESE